MRPRYASDLPVVQSGLRDVGEAVIEFRVLDARRELLDAEMFFDVELRFEVEYAPLRQLDAVRVRDALDLGVEVTRLRRLARQTRLVLFERARDGLADFFRRFGHVVQGDDALDAFDVRPD